MEAKIVRPEKIEEESFAIITRELGDRILDEKLAPIVKRVIHTTADFDYVDNLYFSPDAVNVALEAINRGALIFTDTNMARSGINKTMLSQFGGEALCYIADEDVASSAKSRATTRAVAAVDKAASLMDARPLVFAVGNAPTALMRIVELQKKGKLSPSFVIGAPVGFVNVVESKEQLREAGIPSIIARGRKGGSNVAAAICNALLYMAAAEKGISR